MTDTAPTTESNIDHLANYAAAYAQLVSEVSKHPVLGQAQTYQNLVRDKSIPVLTNEILNDLQKEGVVDKYITRIADSFTYNSEKGEAQKNNELSAEQWKNVTTQLNALTDAITDPNITNQQKLEWFKQQGIDTRIDEITTPRDKTTALTDLDDSLKTTMLSWLTEPEKALNLLKAECQKEHVAEAATDNVIAPEEAVKPTESASGEENIVETAQTDVETDSVKQPETAIGEENTAETPQTDVKAESDITPAPNSASDEKTNEQQTVNEATEKTKVELTGEQKDSLKSAVQDYVSEILSFVHGTDVKVLPEAAEALIAQSGDKFPKRLQTQCCHILREKIQDFKLNTDADKEVILMAGLIGYAKGLEPPVEVPITQAYEELDHLKPIDLLNMYDVLLSNKPAYLTAFADVKQTMKESDSKSFTEELKAQSAKEAKIIEMGGTPKGIAIGA